MYMCIFICMYSTSENCVFNYGCLRIIMLPLPPSGRLGLECCRWEYWLLAATAEIVAGIEEVVMDTLHGCWGS